MRRILTTCFVLIAISLFAGTKIKFATLAPDGSTWMNVMKDYAKAVKDATNGEIKFKIYPGGVSGDEKDVLRKMRIGQLHSAGFTGVGLGEILPEVRILDAPFLFNSYEEVDYVSSRLFDYFSEKFEKKGYVLLGWAEVGFVYVMTNQPVKSLADMSGVKMWMWEGDPIAKATFSSINISPIPLSITDVLTSLQTNLIDGVYVSPLGCVALQWHTKVKYLLDLPLADSNGAVLITKKQFNKLDAEQQATLLKLSKEYFGKLTQMSREDNAKSLDLIKEAGIQFTEINDPAALGSFKKTGKQARQALVGKLYDQALLDRVEGMLTEFRAKK